MRAFVATLLARRAYRNSVIDDRPHSEAYFAVRYGSLAKLWNFVRVRGDYRRMRTRVRCFPYIVRVEPVSACNLRCPLCPMGLGEIERTQKAMSAESLDAFLGKCGRYALYAVLWVWGEPLLNKNLAQLVAVCRRRGIGSEISSHLSMPLSEQRIDDLIRSGLDWLIVSCDAATSEAYDQYRIGGNFDQVVRNLRAIVARKKELRSSTPFVEWQFVPLRHNEHEMDDVIRLAREIGVDGVRFKPARLDKVRNYTFEGLVPVQSVAQWSPANPALVRVVTPTRKSFHDFHCPFLWASVSIFADGAMAPCCETTAASDDVGNLCQQEFEQIWNGPAYVRARRAALGLADDPSDTRVACHGCKVFSKPRAKAAC